METKFGRNGKAIASLIVSCVGTLNCCLWYIGIICGAVGVVLGILALRDENKNQRDLAVAGVVVGGVAIALGIVAAVLYIMLATAGGTISNPPASGSDTALFAIKNLFN